METGGMGWWTWRRLRQQWVQSVFIVLGLGVGVAVVTVVATNLWAGEQQSRKWFTRSGELESVYVQPRRGQDSSFGSLFGPDAPVAKLITGDERPVEELRFSVADLLAVRQEVPGVGAVAMGGMSSSVLPIVGIDGMPLENGASTGSGGRTKESYPVQSGGGVSLGAGGVSSQWVEMGPPQGAQLSIWQVTPDQFKLEEAKLLGGSLLTWDDFAAGRPVVVVEESWAKSVFAQLPTAAAAVGHTFTVWRGAQAGQTWTIVGVIADLPKTSPLHMARPERSRLGGRSIKGLAFACDTSTQMVWQRSSPTFGQLTLRPASGVTPAELARRLQAFFDLRVGAQRVEVVTLASQLRQGNALRWRYLGTLAGLASLALIVGAVNVLNLNLAYVFQRQRYLGLAVALGASRRRLLWQSLADSLWLGLVGGGLGVALTIPGLRLLQVVQQMNQPASVRPSAESLVLWQPNPGVLAIGWAVALVISLVFGLIPALQAQRVSPTEVLRE